MATQVFAGSIAENYHRYLVPLIFEEYARDLALRTRVPRHGAVLEIACGTGVLTRHLRDTLPETARLVATDVNPAMVDAARTNVESHRTIEYRPADGTALPFADGSFDVVFCQFGVMFYPDKGLGYREAARVLKPGGTFVFNVWDSLERNPLCGIVHDTVVRTFPEDPPNFLALPFGYHDIDEIRSELQSAGFSDVTLSVLPRESRAPSARDVATALLAGSPLATQLAELGRDRQAFEAVEAALVENYGSDDVAAPMQSIAIVARR